MSLTYLIEFDQDDLTLETCDNRAFAESRARAAVEMKGKHRADVYAWSGDENCLLVTFHATPDWVKEAWGRSIERRSP